MLMRRTRAYSSSC